MVRAAVLRSLSVWMVAFALGGVVILATSQVRVPTTLISPIDLSTTPHLAEVGDLPDVTIETSNGYHTTFGATTGHFRIATMFYSHCPGVCPMTIDTLRRIDSQLTAAQQAKLNFMLLSLDPLNDTPARMSTMVTERGINSARWLVGRASVHETAAFAGAARFSYRKLSDGSIDHSSAAVLLDEQGRVIARTNDLENSPEFTDAVRRAIRSIGSH